MKACTHRQETRDKRQMQPAPMLLVGLNDQLRQAYNMIPTNLHKRNPPKYKQTPLWGSKLTIGKNVTCSYNVEI